MFRLNPSFLMTNVAVTTAHIRDKLISQLPASQCEVEDTSSGCGAFYRITVTSAKFRGMTLIQQHRLVNEILKNEIPKLHGLTISTLLPSEEATQP